MIGKCFVKLFFETFVFLLVVMGASCFAYAFGLKLMLWIFWHLYHTPIVVAVVAAFIAVIAVLAWITYDDWISPWLRQRKQEKS